MLVIIMSKGLPRDRHATDEARRRLITDYLEATLVADLTLVGACLTDDCLVWLPKSAESAGFVRPLRGRGAFVDLVKRMHESDAHWRPRSLTPQRFFFADDGVAVHLRLIGAMPNGAVYDNDYVFVYLFHGDRICEIREFTDTAYIGEFLAQNQASSG